MVRRLNIVAVLFVMGQGVLSAQNFWQQTSGPNAGPVATLVSHPDGSQFAGTTDGVFKTTNAGVSWIGILSGLGNLNVLALTVTPNGTVIAGTQAGVYRLPNQGLTWQQTSLTGAQVQAVGARSSTEIYAGLPGPGVFKSTNDGASWNPTVLGNVTPSSFAFSGGTGPVFAGTASGVFRSTDAGTQWVQVNNGLTNTAVSAVVVENSGVVFAGTVDGGMFRSTNDGALWTPINSGLLSISISSLATNSLGHIFAGTNAGVFRTIDRGARWQPINAGLSDLGIHSLHVNSAGFLFAGGGNGLVFRSALSTDGTFTVIQPNGGEDWQIGTVQQIRWNSARITGRVRIELTRNAGASYSTIVDSTANTGVYPTTISPPATTQARIRVSSYVDPVLADSSDGLFSISTVPAATITVVAPNGGENWQIGTTQNIQWTSSNLPGRVRIEISRNGGQTFGVVVDSTNNTGSFPWSVTGPATAQGRIRISSIANGNVVDISDNDFAISIPPSITMRVPNGGEVWQIGTTQNIQWTSINVTGRVKIEVSRDGGQVFATIADSAINTETFPWIVTGPATVQGRVRISSIVNSNVVDISDNDFTISIQPSITVGVPNGGEVWQIGTTQNIQWTSINVSGRVKIEVSRDGGQTFAVIADSTNNTGTFPWLVTGPATVQGRVRISSIVLSTVFDISDANFTIVPAPSITLVVPNGGENWQVGSTQNIQWTSTNLSGRVRIELSRDGAQTFTVITDSTNNTGLFPWTVTGPATARGRVRIRSIVTSNVVDVSDTNFTISLPPISVTVVVPNGGEDWQIGTIQNIQWTSANLQGNVRIEISRNGGQSFAVVTDGTSNTGVYPWSVTEPATAQGRIRISSVVNGTVVDISDNNFTISAAASITVVVPNGGEDWQIGTTQNIHWTSTSVLGKVSIELSRDGAQTYTVITDSTDNTGVFSWLVNGPSTTRGRVRIRSIVTSSAVDVSDTNFIISVLPTSLTVTVPNGGEDWQIGTTQNIQWTSANLQGKVKIELSRNGAQTFTVIADSTENTGTYPWSVTGPATAQGRVRISSITLSGAVDVSDNNFTISPPPAVTVVRPNGGEALQIGSFDTIRWTSVGVAGNARIELSRDGGTSFAIIDTNAPNLGTYLWMVSGPATSLARIRIAFHRPGLPPLADTSDNDFGVSALNVIAPDTVSSETSPTVVVQPPSGYGVTSAKLYVRNGGKTAYDSLTLTQIGSAFQASIPPRYINIRGVQFYVLLSSGQGSITFPDSIPSVNPAFIRVRVRNVLSPSAFQRRTYKMVSVPLDLVDPTLVGAFVDDYGVYNRSKWRVFRWEGQGYVEFPGFAATVSPGNAFWLITHAGTPFDVEEGLSVSTSQSHAVTIPPGWSQVADPFAFRVDWNGVVGGNLLSGPYYYDRGAYRAVTVRVLQPWEGYFVHNGSPQPVSIAIPPFEADSTLLFANDWPEGSSYSLRFTASVLGSGLADAENIIGFAGSSVGAHDYPEPPMISDEFVRLTVAEGSENHIASLKQVPTEGAFWDMKLSTTLENKAIHVQMSEHGQLPQGFEIFILDKDNAALIPVQAGAFNMYVRTATRSLRVVVGTRKFAEENSEDIPLVPLQYDLSQNYPNPFNPETTIRFQLGKRSHVRLEIFNVVGQRVRTLVSSEQTTGTYEVVWDGTNDAGRSVSSGVYVYRLKAEANAGGPGDRLMVTRKMVLIR